MQDVRDVGILDPQILLENLKIGNVPDIFKITKEYEFVVGVFREDDIIENGKMAENIQGYVVVRENERTIGVKDNLPLQTKRFLIMYLFSSYILNGNGNEFANIVFNETIYNREIYDYALDLLMPDKCFEVLLGLSNGNDDMLTKIYNVSNVVLEEKIKKIEYKNKLEVRK